MNRRRVFAVVCWALLTIFLGWRSAVSGRHPVKAREMDADAPPPPSEQERTQERAALELQTRQQVAELTRLEKERQKGIELAGKQRERLMRLQITLANAWSNVLSTNWTAYQELRRKAAASTRKAAPCTICDGNGMMHFCIVCENSGKCIDCNGKGKTAYGEPCPACRGKGRCYLCGGAGQMPCVFCDDGLVYSEGVPPPTNLPLPSGMEQRIQVTPGPHREYVVAQSAPSAQSTPTTPAAPPASPEKPAENSPQPPSPASVQIDTSPRTLGFAATILVGIFALRRRMRVIERVQNKQQNLPVAQPMTAPRPKVLSGESNYSEPQSTFKGGFARPLTASQTPQDSAVQQYYEIAPERVDSIKTSFSQP